MDIDDFIMTCGTSLFSSPLDTATTSPSKVADAGPDAHRQYSWELGKIMRAVKDSKHRGGSGQIEVSQDQLNNRGQ